MHTARKYALPEIAQTLGDLWAEVLQLGQRPAHTDNFFELGGDSMTLTLLEFRIKEELGVAIEGPVLMNCASLDALAMLVRTKIARTTQETG